MYKNNIVNIQESTTILNASTKGLETYWMHFVHISVEFTELGNWKKRELLYTLIMGLIALLPLF